MSTLGCRGSSRAELVGVQDDRDVVLAGPREGLEIVGEGDDPRLYQLQARLFLDLPEGALLEGLAHLQQPARNGVGALVPTLALAQQDPLPALDDDPQPDRRMLWFLAHLETPDDDTS
jgi:hypothetical protein